MKMRLGRWKCFLLVFWTILSLFYHLFKKREELFYCFSFLFFFFLDEKEAKITQSIILPKDFVNLRFQACKEKAALSHRGKATRALIEFLNSLS